MSCSRFLRGQLAALQQGRTSRFGCVFGRSGCSQIVQCSSVAGEHGCAAPSTSCGNTPQASWHSRPTGASVLTARRAWSSARRQRHRGFEQHAPRVRTALQAAKTGADEDPDGGTVDAGRSPGQKVCRGSSWHAVCGTLCFSCVALINGSARIWTRCTSSRDPQESIICTKQAPIEVAMEPVSFA